MAERNRIDRRVQRTRKLLKEALFALILEKGYDAVTIEDITERADLGRTTFYLHYHDKEGLLLESIKAIADDLLAQISPISPFSWNADGGSPVEEAKDPIVVIFKHAADNAQLYQIILRGEGAVKASSRVQSIISESVIQVIESNIRQGSVTLNPQVPVQIFAHYLAGSLTGLIIWWLDSGLPYTPAEMAHMFRKMFFLGGRKVLGLED